MCPDRDSCISEASIAVKLLSKCISYTNFSRSPQVVSVSKRDWSSAIDYMHHFDFQSSPLDNKEGCIHHVMIGTAGCLSSGRVPLYTSCNDWYCGVSAKRQGPTVYIM